MVACSVAYVPPNVTPGTAGYSLDEPAESATRYGIATRQLTSCRATTTANSQGWCAPSTECTPVHAVLTTRTTLKHEPNHEDGRRQHRLGAPHEPDTPRRLHRLAVRWHRAHLPP